MVRHNVFTYWTIAAPARVWLAPPEIDDAGRLLPTDAASELSVRAEHGIGSD